MTFKFARIMLVCLALALPGTAVFAAVNPIPGVDVIVKSHPAGRTLTVHTDGSGRARLEGLAPGGYVLTVGGQSLVAAMDRLAAARRNGGGRASAGARFAPPGQRRANPSGRASITAPTAGGSDVAEAIAVGDLNGDGVPDVAARGGPAIRLVLDLGPLGHFSSVAPYRRDKAEGGAALAFTIPNRGVRPGQAVSGTVVVSAISDQASAGNLTSY